MITGRFTGSIYFMFLKPKFVFFRSLHSNNDASSTDLTTFPSIFGFVFIRLFEGALGIHWCSRQGRMLMRTYIRNSWRQCCYVWWRLCIVEWNCRWHSSDGLFSWDMNWSILFSWFDGDVRRLNSWYNKNICDQKQKELLDERRLYRRNCKIFFFKEITRKHTCRYSPYNFCKFRPF